MKEEYRPMYLAKFFNVSRMAVNKWIRKGKVCVYKTIGGHYRISREEIIRLIKKSGKLLPTNKICKGCPYKGKGE